MGRIHSISIAFVMGAALCGCAKTQTNPRESADPSPQPAAGGSAPVASTAPSPAATPAALDIGQTCPLEIKRQIACKDAYLPMIVDVRIRLDLPPGTADQGRDDAGRAELLAIATQEFPEHYTVEKIPAICSQRQAMAERMPPKMLEELAAMGPGCHTAEDCDGFVKCLAPVVERILAWTAESGPR